MINALPVSGLPRPIADRSAYEAAGLSYDTKFDLRQLVDLPYTSGWFSVPPSAPFGQSPKLGILHPSLARAVQAAFRAATT